MTMIFVQIVTSISVTYVVEVILPLLNKIMIYLIIKKKLRFSLYIKKGTLS